MFLELVGGVAYQAMHRAVAEPVPVSWEEFGEPVIPIHEKFDTHKICRDVAMQRLYKKIRFIFKGNWY